MPDGELRGDVGGPTDFVAAPAVMNAIHRATGTRIRILPLARNELS